MVSAAILHWAAFIAAAGQGEAPSAAARAVEVQSIWDFLIKGGPVMVPIALCSLAALAVIVERCVVLRRARVMPAGFLEGVRGALAGGTPRAVAYCVEHASPIANIFHAGLKRIAATPERREKAIEEAGAREVFTLRRYLRLLAVVATMAQLLGLLGTIFGMIKAFQTVALAGDALGKTELLAKGIYEALITTAAGLVVAIPALVCYHALAARVDRLIHEMDQMVVAFFEEREPAPAGALSAPAVRIDPPLHAGHGDGDGHAAVAAALSLG